MILQPHIPQPNTNGVILNLSVAVRSLPGRAADIKIGVGEL